MLKHLLSMLRRWVYALFFALDLLLSAITFGAPMETLSARLAKARDHGSKIWSPVANAVDWVVWVIFHQDAHCETAWVAYTARESAASAWNG